MMFQILDIVATTYDVPDLIYNDDPDIIFVAVN